MQKNVHWTFATSARECRKRHFFAYFIPVDEEHSIIALRFYNRITGVKAIDKLIARLGSLANKVVERQDKRIVETQLPRATGISIGENLVAADLPIMEYRSRRHELQQKPLEWQKMRTPTQRGKEKLWITKHYLNFLMDYLY